MRTIKLLFYSSLLVVIFIGISSSLSFGQQWCWGQEGSGILKANDLNSAVATDRSGNAYFTGQYEDEISVQSISLKDSSDQMYLLKFDAAGKLLWALQPAVDSANLSFGLAVATDPSNNVYVSGYYSGGILKFGPYSVSGGLGYLVKFNSAGKPLWVVQYPGAGYAVTTNGTGDIYVGTDDELLKYNANGTLIGASSTPQVNSVATDDNLNVYITGFFKGKAIFGTDTLKAFLNDSTPETDVYLVKYSSTGGLLWAEQSQVPSARSDGYGYSVITDPTNNVYITGYFKNRISFASYSLLSNNHDSISCFLIKYTPAGNVIWAKESSGKDSWRGYSLSADKYNHVYMGGAGMGDTLTFNGTNIIANGQRVWSSFISQLDTSGTVLKGSILKNGVASPYKEYQISISSDTTGNFVYMGGTFYNDTVICGPNILLDSNGGIVPYYARWTSGTDCVVQAGIDAITSPTSSVSLFPNPNNGKFVIRRDAMHGVSTGASAIIEIYNVLGEKVLSETLRSSQPARMNGSGGDDNLIDLNNKPNGVYLYRVLTENGEQIETGKFIIGK